MTQASIPNFPASAPRIAGIATAVPPYRLSQSDVADHAADMFADRYRDFERMRPVFENTGIESRYSVRPLDWFQGDKDWQVRTDAYLDGATDLFVEAARKAMDAAEILADAVDTVVTISSTGIATPSLEARAHATLGLRPDVRRVPVFGLGCAGGVSGLSLGTRLAKADPGSTVLVVAVEICTLAFRADELTKSNIVATALFGDGAAALVLTSDEKDGVRVVATGEHLWPQTLGVMGWSVDPVGFGAIFSASIPDLVTEKMRPAVARFLERHDETVEAIDGFAFHPGGTKVVNALETTFGLPQGALNVEREVLRDFGNMSAPTALFVLERKLAAGMSGRNLMASLGPGFTGSFARLDA